MQATALNCAHLTLVRSLRPGKWCEVAQDLQKTCTGCWQTKYSAVSQKVLDAYVQATESNPWYLTQDELNCSQGNTDDADQISIDYSLNSDTWLT